MSLDHETGTMTGTVLAGHFAGMRLDELSLADLLALLRECRAADPDGARLLEAYLDRRSPPGATPSAAASDPPPPTRRQRRYDRRRRRTKSSACRPAPTRRRSGRRITG